MQPRWAFLAASQRSWEATRQRRKCRKRSGMPAPAASAAPLSICCRAAHLNWEPDYAHGTPLDAASGPGTRQDNVISWLRELGARPVESAQYTSKDFAALARANGVILSVSRKGECWDNAVAESFFATIRRELINDRTWPTQAGLQRAVFEYIEGWYNTRRLHSALGYLSPAEYELTHRNAARQAA
jgi:Integrase core domain